MTITETKNLIIRKFKATDWKDLSEILTDESVVYYEPYDVFTVDQCKEEAIKFSESDNFFAVVLKAEDKVIGKLYFNKETSRGTDELGYTFNALYQGKGYAKESSAALMDYAFNHMGIHRIIAIADVTNTRSWKLLEKLGMRREGCFLQSSYSRFDENKNPVWCDFYLYAILSNEWKQRITML